MLRALYTSFILACVCVAPLPATQAQGFATIDLTNFGQNLITALESIDQTLTQLDQYRSQLETKMQMVRDTAAPAIYAWDTAESITVKVKAAVDVKKNLRDAFEKMKRDTKSLGDPDYYRGSPCYGGRTSCSKEEWQRKRKEQLTADRELAAIINKTSDALIELSKAEGKSIQSDAKQTAGLQQQAQQAKGKRQTDAAMLQMLNMQIEQLLAMRRMLAEQATAAGLKMKREAERDARHRVNHEKLWQYRNGTSKPSNREW